MTLTCPPAGRSRSASIARARASVIRLGATSLAAMLADASMTMTRSRAKPAGPLQERPRGEEREDQHQEQLEQQEEAPPEALPRGVGLDVGEQPLPEQGRRHDPLVAAELEQVEGDDERDEREAGQGERGQERHRQPTTRRRRSSAKMTSASGTSEVSGTYAAARRAARSARPACHAASRAL